MVAQLCLIKTRMSQLQQWLWQSDSGSGDTMTTPLVAFLQEQVSVVLNSTCALLIHLLSCFAVIVIQLLHFCFSIEFFFVLPDNECTLCYSCIKVSAYSWLLLLCHFCLTSSISLSIRCYLPFIFFSVYVSLNFLRKIWLVWFITEDSCQKELSQQSIDIFLWHLPIM